MATSTIKIPSANKVKVTSLTYTFGGKNWIFYKVDRIVVVLAPSDITSASAGMNDITTSLPAEYRPSTQCYIGNQNAGNDNQSKCFLAISSTGAVKFYTPVAIASAQNCGICGCYITAS